MPLPLYNDTSYISFLADVCRLITLIVLLTTIRRAKNSNGLSGKTQLLYAVIYALRTVGNLIGLSDFSIDVFLSYHRASNDLYQVVSNAAFTCITYFIIHSIYVSFRKTYSKEEDSCRVWRLMYLCIPPALLVTHDYSVVADVIWTYTIYLEALAMMPQIYRLSATSTRTVGVFMALTLFHRILYICHLIFCIDDSSYSIYLAASIVEIIINLEYLLTRMMPGALNANKQAKDLATKSKDAEVGSNHDIVYSITLTPAALIADGKANLIENDEKSVK